MEEDDSERKENWEHDDVCEMFEQEKQKRIIEFGKELGEKNSKPADEISF